MSPKFYVSLIFWITNLGLAIAMMTATAPHTSHAQQAVIIGLLFAIQVVNYIEGRVAKSFEIDG